MCWTGFPCRAEVRRNHLSAISNVIVIDGSVEHGERSNRLVVWYKMTRFIDTKEGEIAILANFAVFDSIDCHRLVSGSRKLRLMDIVDSERYCLAAKPVTDVVSISIIEGDADTGVKKHFKILDEIRIDEVTGLLERPVDIIVCFSVIEIDSDGILYLSLVQISFQVVWWCWIFVRMPGVDG